MIFSKFVHEAFSKKVRFSKDTLNNIINIITISILCTLFSRFETLIKLFIENVTKPNKSDTFLPTISKWVFEKKLSYALDELWEAISVFIISMIVLGINFYIKDRGKKFRIQCNVLLLILYYIVIALIYIFIYDKEFSWVVRAINFQVILEYSILFILFSIIIVQQRQNKIYKDNLVLLEQKKKIELQSFKQNINSDFFIDNLDSLSSLIEEGKEDRILNYIESISYIYRYILENDKRDTIELADELKYAEHYCQLFVLRYKQNVSFNFDFSNTENYQILPLSIQYCIECSAIFLKNENCKVSKISAFLKNSYLHFSIEGQGFRMTEEISEILNNLSDRFRSLTECEFNALFDSNHLLIKLPVRKNENI